MHFGSDNTGPVAPQIMDAIVAANQGYANPYGEDLMMDQVRDKIRTIFEAPEAAVFLVATGTAANALSIATYIDPWQTVFCHKAAHVEIDECGAPEFFTGGAKLVPLAGDNAKIAPSLFKAALASVDSTDPHVVQRGLLTITQLTERGTAYSLAEIRELTGIAKSYNMPCHLDGARFTNALVALGCSPAEMTWKSGIDAVSFGGSKNGLMGVEAVILFDPKKAWEFELRRKRAAQLVSKGRYLSAQILAYLTDNLWLDLAAKANDAAEKLEAAVLSLPGGKLDFPRHGNMIFAAWPRAGHQRAQAGGVEYSVHFGQSLEGPDDDLLSARLVTNWATTDQQIRDFVKAVTG
ncbi:MAG: threonine aldolase [Paracoccaceae bacterium]|jgi:threonine aldolase